jgi:hypothetical protein
MLYGPCPHPALRGPIAGPSVSPRCTCAPRQWGQRSTTLSHLVRREAGGYETAVTAIPRGGTVVAVMLLAALGGV